MALGKHDEAYAMSSVLIRQNQSNSSLLITRARCLYLMGNLDSAVKHLQVTAARGWRGVVRCGGCGGLTEWKEGGGCSRIMHWPCSPYDHRHSLPCSAGTEHVGFQPTRQIACTKREAPRGVAGLCVCGGGGCYVVMSSGGQRSGGGRWAEAGGMGRFWCLPRVTTECLVWFRGLDWIDLVLTLCERALKVRVLGARSLLFFVVLFRFVSCLVRVCFLSSIFFGR